MMISQQRWTELITAENSVERVGDNSYNFLSLQRYGFDKSMYDRLEARQMLWMRGYNDREYDMFIYNGSDILENIKPDYDVIECHLIGPIVVALKKGTNPYLKNLVKALNRSPIMPQRVL